MDEYLRKAFEEVFSDDGLVVMARGLGIDRLYAKFTQYYSSSDLLPEGESRRKLVLCLNCSGHEDALRELLLADGVIAARLPCVINNEVLSHERLERYLSGGCYFITSRILIVDLLDRKLDAAKVTGLLVYNAHKINELSIEAFVLRVFRERNRDGFIKAFSDEPEALQSGFGKVERLMRVLYVQKLFLWPRFRIEVDQALKRQAPEVTELSLALTPQMKAIQSAILVAMKTTLQEIKKSLPHLDSAHITLENGLFHAFDYQLRSQLDPEWHKISFRTKQLVGDLGVLRKLLDYLVRYDAFSFYYLLMKLYASSSEQSVTPSLWLTSQAADEIFRRAKERVYKIVPKNQLNSSRKRSEATSEEITSALRAKYGLDGILEPVNECPPKWKMLEEVLSEIRELHFKQHAQDQKGGIRLQDRSNRILLVARDNLSLMQLRDVTVAGSEYVAEQRFRWFVSQQAAEIRSRCKRRVTTQLVRRNQGRSAAHNQNLHSQQQKKTGSLDDGTDSGLSTLQQAQMMLFHSQQRQDEGNIDEALVGVDMDDMMGVPAATVPMLPAEQKLLLLQETLMQQTSYSTSIASSTISLQERKEHSVVIDLTDKCGGVEAVTGGDSDESMERERKRQKHSFTSLDADECMKSTRSVDDLDGAICHCAPLDPHLHTVMVTQEEISDNPNWLSDIGPQYIILYDPHVTTIRSIEAYQSQHSDETPLRIFFLSYEGSTEEHRYVGALAKEKKAFEALISAKEHLVISLPDHPLDLRINESETHEVTDTRRIGNKINSSSDRRIVVDVREFRSSLPAMLHASQHFHLVPRTIAVGDYVLTSEICVERKGITDLFQSFASGRLYNQAESMSKYYKYPCLLIEFAADKAFTLLTHSEIPADVHQYSITSRICLLALSFPNLRILWSRSSSSTVDIFRMLSMNREDVDVEKAVSVGGGDEATHNAITSDGGDAVVRDSRVIADEEEARTTAQTILLSLPGISANNYRSVMQNVESLAELSTMAVHELAPMIGPVNAKKLHDFFHRSRND